VTGPSGFTPSQLEILREVLAQYSDQPLHPMAGVRWEQDRCPDCGVPGVEIRRLGVFRELACPVREPEVIAAAFWGTS
jgi:hypothetical protein